MKILYAIDSLGRGGAEHLLVNLLPILQKRGVSCEVVALMAPYDLAENLEEAGIVVHRLNLNHRWNFVQGVTKLTALLYSGQFDIVHSQLFFAAVYTALSRLFVSNIKRLVLFQNVDYKNYSSNSLWKKFRQALHLWLMRNCMDGRVAVSDAVARHYEFLLKFGEIPVIHNAISLERIFPINNLDRETILSKYGIADRDFTIIFPARLVEQKGHKYLLKSLNILQNKNLFPKLLLFGNGPLEQEIRKQIVDTGLQKQVMLYAAISQAELLPVMQAADVLVMSSLHEGLPVVATEAMALERPVLATHVEGLTEVVEEGVTGLLVPPADPVALAEGIERLMADALLRKSLGKAGRKRIETYFSADAIATQWQEYYNNLLENRVVIQTLNMTNQHQLESKDIPLIVEEEANHA